MEKEKYRHYKYLLEQLKENHMEVLDDMHEGLPSGYEVTEDSELSRYDNHPADAATELFDAEMQSALKSGQKYIIKEIDDALNRIEAGNYGICETCGNSIEPERLEIIPYARNCVKCESLKEQELKYDMVSKSGHRPVEEDVLEKEMRGDYIHDIESDEPYDGEQALEEVLSFGSSDSPQDGAPLGNRQDAKENDRSVHEITDVDQISNEMYKKQLT
ncbi:TraR/DksA C4-type zinc finger protein [Thermoclostridium stercorarium]|uniref:TraR/DksA C4-type zinc finger protein n=1 Tax=Thermoclostridium stercorarium TaxID=1510 RepID=UPI0004B51A13|nr:TraR/DksA C4-type zinc finger protein [Thermoclostridium stercorarium]UZQ85669.1 TraR/DksA C4-type zinc finger protein [Thermoclostridium stercorarium]